MRQSSMNPSLQCKTCGRWMRLSGRDEKGSSFQRFYGSCYNGGDHIAKDGTPTADVCDACCLETCGKRK